MVRASKEHQKKKVISKSNITTRTPIKFLVTLTSLAPQRIVESEQLAIMTNLKEFTNDFDYCDELAPLLSPKTS